MYHKDRQKGCIKFSYPTACATGLLAILKSDIWLLFLGIGNAAQGAAGFLMSLDRDMNSRGRNEFRLYGLKTMAVGFLLAVLEISLHGPDSLSAYGFFMKAIPMSALLIDSFRPHMNREFFYPHLEPIEDNM